MVQKKKILDENGFQGFRLEVFGMYTYFIVTKNDDSNFRKIRKSMRSVKEILKAEKKSAPIGANKKNIEG